MTGHELINLLLLTDQNQQVTLPGEHGAPIQYVKEVRNSNGDCWVELS